VRIFFILQYLRVNFFKRIYKYDSRLIPGFLYEVQTKIPLLAAIFSKLKTSKFI